MKIHEYQAKDILRKYGVPVPEGEMATTLEEADKAAKTLFGKGNVAVVVKAQIHAGGRGKGGGVKVTKTIEDADAAAKAILGMQLVTHQTGPAGQKVQRLLIEAGSAIARELYLGLVLDRASAKVVFMASQAGGMEIEQGDRASGARYARAHLQRDHRAGHRPPALPGPQAGIQAGPRAQADQPGGLVHDGPLQGVR
jgi:succinyl-CoA synthetase beta subunit